jgi:predicted  nucleic acid-binding Zn-ribbon protein
MILREDVFGFIFKQGEFYQDVIAGMERTIKFMETLAAEHAHQVQTLQDLVEVIKQGGVLQAEKRLSKLERKFRGVSYRRCDEAIQEAVRPLRDAKRAESEVEEYLKKRQGLMGKLFKDKDTLRKLETSISAVRSQAGALPKGELRDVVTGLCQKMEASLK